MESFNGRKPMRAICVDDERLLMEEIKEYCGSLSMVDEVRGFTRAEDALSWLENNSADLAILDTDMPGMDGIELATRVKAKHPDMDILFLSDNTKYAVDAFAIHASGYILKPVNRDRLSEEVKYLLERRQERIPLPVLVKTFGEFDLFINGEPVSFPRSKAKELLAYLVDRQGVGVTRKMIFAVLWEDGGEYNRSMQKYLDVIIRSLRDTLTSYGAEEILEIKKGVLRIVPEKIDCDMYRFFAGDEEAVNSYRGEYMSDYPWASMGEAYMDRTKRMDV